jgi:plasmid stability protein
LFVAQALIRKLNDETLNDYRAAARKKGRSLEAELRELIEQNRPKRRLSPQEREELSKKLTEGQRPSADSAPLIREFREMLDARLGS